MIRIVIELIPHGRIKDKKQIGEAIIINDGTGIEKKGNYQYCLWGKIKRPYKTGVIIDFPRKSKNIWYLLKRILENI